MITIYKLIQEETKLTLGVVPGTEIPCAGQVISIEDEFGVERLIRVKQVTSSNENTVTVIS